MKKIDARQAFRPDAIVFGSEQYENVEPAQEQQPQYVNSILSKPLVLPQVTSSDQGEYICFIQNDKVTNYRKAFITVAINRKGKPFENLTLAESTELSSRRFRSDLIVEYQSKPSTLRDRYSTGFTRPTSFPYLLLSSSPSKIGSRSSHSPSPSSFALQRQCQVCDEASTAVASSVGCRHSIDNHTYQ